MYRSQVVSRVVCRWLSVSRRWVLLSWYTLVASVLLVSCSWPFGGASTPISSSATPGTVQLGLAQVRWCSKPVMVFQDKGASTATATTLTPTASVTPTVAATTSVPVKDWEQVKANLGFTVYLPATLPGKTCLVSASGTIHDPMLGSNFTIGYLLSDHSSITISETSLRSQRITFQCSPFTGTGSSTGSTQGTPTVTTSTQNSVMLCTGARDTTRIVFLARGTSTTLQRFFTALQPNVNWIPAS